MGASTHPTWLSAVRRIAAGEFFQHLRCPIASLPLAVAACLPQAFQSPEKNKDFSKKNLLRKNADLGFSNQGEQSKHSPRRISHRMLLTIAARNVRSKKMFTNFEGKL